MARMLPANRHRFWPDHRTLRRWHFYAGLFCIPFILLLSGTGMIYLFKPQIDDIIDRRYEQLAPPMRPASPAAEVRAALAALPGAHLLAYELPRSERSAARVIVVRDGIATRAYVAPASLEVLKTVPEEQRFERIIFNLHGQLLLGNRGSVVVELAASWAIVMILTGLCLWWPRSGSGGAAGLLYPRLGSGRRTFWRDLHAVTGVWVSAFALLLLMSGLPWAYAWGNYLAAVRAIASPAAVTQDWQVGHVPAKVEIAGGPAPDTMEGMAGMATVSPKPDRGYPLDAIDKVAAILRPLDLAYPVLLTPPKAGSLDWTARSDAQNRTLRTTLIVSPEGRIKSRVDFGKHKLLDRVIGIGVSAHEGHLFGWINMVLSAFTALSLAMVSISAIVLWLRRRPSGTLGAPPHAATRPVAAGFLCLLLILAVAFPLLGTSMMIVLVIEHLVLRRIPRVRDWLGLAPPDKIAAV